MKSSKIVLVSLLGVLGVATLNVYASPRAAEASGSHYLMAADDLEGWHLGGFYRYADREVANGALALKQNKFIMHLGRDLLSWLSVYGMVGTSSAKLSPSAFEAEYASEYGGGIWVNFLDHDLLNNLALETRLRLQGIAQISTAEPEINGFEDRYVETYAALTLNIVNEIIGNKNYWPEAIGLFFGPVYNKVEFDDTDVTGDEVGLTVGLDLHFSRNIAMSLGLEAFDDDNVYNVALNYRF